MLCAHLAFFPCMKFRRLKSINKPVKDISCGTSSCRPSQLINRLNKYKNTTIETRLCSLEMCQLRKDGFVINVKMLCSLQKLTVC